MIGFPDPLGPLGAFDPFGIAGDIAGRAAADGWTGIMLAIWSAGLWVLRYVLDLMDQLLTPDISGGGPAGDVYQVTFWAAGAVVLVMVLVQLGVTALRRDGKSLARAVIGAGQFAIVWGAWIGYGIVVLAACGGLTRALMGSLLKVDTWSQWNPVGDYDFTSGSIEVATATVLGILGLFVWVAAIGHFVVMLTRAAALLVLTAVTPVAAAGLVSEAGRSWFWKSLRWFHAAALTPVLAVLVMGLGVKLTTNTAHGQASGAEAAIGTALPGVMLILISVVAPVALFRLLAFVDPGTSSGAAMRAGMSSAGGLQGLLSGGGPSGGQASSAASATTSSWQSQGEAQSNEATANRFGSGFAAVGGTAGGAYAAGLGLVAKTGAAAASIGIDDMNQTAVGDSSYFPDYQRGPQRFNPDARDPQDSSGDGQDDDGGQGQGPGGGGPPHSGAHASTAPTAGPSPTPSGSPGAPGGGGAGAGAAGGAV